MTNLRQLEIELEKRCTLLRIGEMEIVWQPYAIATGLAPVLSKVFERSVQLHAIQRLAQTAVALRLYRLERGRYPDNLQALVSKYLPKVPIDPFDGKPMRYQRLAKGFKVWSIGPNLKDEGGMEVMPRDLWKRGDIVWISKR